MTTSERQIPQPRYWKPVREAIEDIATADPGEPIDVVILGAGMAGLCAAIELAKHDRVKKIDIYEATKDRVGGRVWTYRDPETGQYGELGAMRFPLRHDYTVHYIRDMNLKIRKFYNSGGASDLFEVTRGLTEPQWLTREELKNRECVEKVFGRLSEREFAIVADKGPEGLLGACMEPLMAALRGNESLAKALVAGEFEHHSLLQKWDEQTEQEHVDNAGLSDAAKRMLESLVSLSNTSHWSLAAMLRGSLTNAPLSDGPWAGLWEIVDGLDRLPWAMKSRLDASKKVTFHFGHAVTKIQRDGNAGVVTFSSGKSVRINNQVRLLTTIPFPVLARRVELSGLSPTKLTAIHRYEYAKATKVLLWSKPQEGGQPFWHTQLGLERGRSMTDRREPTRVDRGVAGTIQTYYPAPTSPAYDPPGDDTFGMVAPAVEPEVSSFWSVHTHVDPDVEVPGAAEVEGEAKHYRLDLLASYTFGANAEELGRIARDKRAEFCVARLEQLYRRDIRQYIIDPADAPSIAWHEYEWTQGAFGMTRPKVLSAHYQAGRRAEGNIYFAGEQISIAPGWIQGAFESALAACRELLSPKRAQETEQP